MTRLRIVFGERTSRVDPGEEEIAFRLAAPVLAGNGTFQLALPAAEVQRVGDSCILDSGDLVAGFLRGTAGAGLEEATRELYGRMFRSAGDRCLYRVWHFIPQINHWENGLENYRLFCRGRADAFQDHFGTSCHSRMPAASAVGSREAEPVILFVAGRHEPVHAENPEQIPAYRYPPTYGPRSPSFARATRVVSEQGEMVFISGTAAIKGSETVYPGDCEQQLAVTLHNLSLIGETSGLGHDLGASTGAARHFVVYLRRPGDLHSVQVQLDQKLLRPGDDIVFLLADICRADLMVEIEATVVSRGAAPPPP